ncbi:MAG: Bug family tripartite tricarboxylate transporter substrate binding protein [Pseudorhodoplanes sp.]
MRKWSLCICAAFLTLIAENVGAFPDRTITVVNTNAAGNTGDIAFRIILPILEQRLGQAIVVVNKPGASGEIAVSEVARATPDGYTLLLAPNNNYVMNQFILKSSAGNPLELLAPITTISAGHSVIVVPANLQVSNLKELQELARKERGKINYGSPGTGTPPHLAAAAFAKLADIEMVHVPYRGSPAVIQGLLTGDIQLYFSVVSAVKGQLDSGKLKALAVAAPQRLDVLPEVPTTAEQGFPELISGSWWALAAPKGTPLERLEKIAAAVQSAFRDPAVLKRFKELNISPGGASAQELENQISQETIFWRKIIPSLKISPL